MFVYDPRPTFTHTVKVRVPVDGGFEDQDFKATFQVMPSDEVANYDLNKGEGSADILGATDFLKKIVVGMSDLIGKDEKPLPYNDQLRDALLRQLYVRNALVRTYFSAVSGAQAGN